MEDWELLRAYGESGSESAFRELVRRYAGLVHSAALRQLRSSALAEEAAQAVFCLLARKAPRLKRQAPLAGWLFRATAFVAKDLERAERRRRIREEEAFQMQWDPHHADPSQDRWEEIAPLLDRALCELGEGERNVLLLRYFQKHDLRTVGSLLAISEDAAKMRVARAVEKLRQWFARKGVLVTAGGLATLLRERSVQAVAPHLLDTLTSLSTAGTSTVSIATQIQWFLFMAKLKNVVTGALLILALGGGGIYLAVHRADESNAEPVEAQRPGVAVAQPTRVVAIRPGQRSAGKEAALSEPELAALRAALYDPPESRRIPVQRVDAALRQLGPKRRAAIPLLMQGLAESDVVIKALATHGLQTLGKEAGEATPELLHLLEDDKLATLNDGLVPLFLAVHPGTDILPQLIDILGKDDPFNSRDAVASMIAALANKDPVGAAAYVGRLEALLTHENSDVRLDAAVALAFSPGEANPQVFDVLQDGLKTKAMLDPHYYDPIVDTNSNTTFVRDAEKWADTTARYRAIGGLRRLGAAATRALPDLELVAAKTDDPQLRKEALEAVGVIAPERRAQPEINELLAHKERAAELVDLIQRGLSGPEDLREALQLQNSAHVAAQALREGDPEVARELLPDARAALEQWGTYEAAQIVKELAPASLVEELGKSKAAYEAAQALAELGKDAEFALPALYQALESGPKEAKSAVGAAIQAIDPSTKPIYHFNDLSPAVTDLLRTAENGPESLNRKIVDVYVERGQDLNQVSQFEVRDFVRAVQRVDPQLGRRFASNLVSANPTLAKILELTPK